MSKGQERRKHNRIEKQYMTRFKIRSDAQEAGSDDWDTVVLKNVSTGGALFLHRKDLGIGTLLDLKIYVKSTLTINCVGEITRIDKPQPNSMFCFAIRFIDIGEQEKELINKAVGGILG
jgi:hypothetical protein